MFIFALFPVLLFITVHIQKIQNEFYKSKYLNSTILSLVGASFLLLMNITKIDYHTFKFLLDYKFYLAQIISIVFMILQFKSRKSNENNLTICYFVNFLSLAIVPFISIVLMYLFQFKNTLEVEYKSTSDIYLLSLSLFVLATFFYLDKFKHKAIHNVKVLIMVFIFGAVSGVFGSKMMQEYDPINYMMVATFFNLLIFGILSTLKEKRKPTDERFINKDNIRKYTFMALGYCVTLYLNTIIISNIPAEQYSIIRNVGIILVNYAYTYYYDKINLVNFKDSLILILMIATLVYFTS